MPELRTDPVSGRWVIIATERAARPTDFKPQPEETNDVARCPFCPGHEGMTPPEIFTVREPGTAVNGPGWHVRVVSNKFPALRIEGDTAKSGVGLFTRMDGVGAHEVIVETPDHHTHLGLLAPAKVAAVIGGYLARYRDLDNDPRFEYALLFRNHGRSAGASLSHPHSQLIALPVVPKRVAEEVEACEQFYGKRGGCVFCRIVEQELRMRERVVFENDRFAAITVFAGRFPFETWVLPKYHAASFGEMAEADMLPCAEALQVTLRALHVCLGNPPYNFIVHTAPYHYQARHAYHWHIEIMPRLTHVAGFEWGSGFFINPVVPEAAARFLREAVAAAPAGALAPGAEGGSP